MRKEWIAIIIILIVGLTSMFIIEQNSTTIGSAITTINDVSITVPPQFKISVSSVDQVILLDEATNETILVKYLNDGNNSLKEFQKEIKAINDNENLEIHKNVTNKIVHTLYCENYEKEQNYTLTYFEKFDRTILIKMENFDNATRHDINLWYIIDNLQPDYKQSRS